MCDIYTGSGGRCSNVDHARRSIRPPITIDNWPCTCGRLIYNPFCRLYLHAEIGRLVREPTNPRHVRCVAFQRPYGPISTSSDPQREAIHPLESFVVRAFRRTSIRDFKGEEPYVSTAANIRERVNRYSELLIIENSDKVAKSGLCFTHY